MTAHCARVLRSINFIYVTSGCDVDLSLGGRWETELNASVLHIITVH